MASLPINFSQYLLLMVVKELCHKLFSVTGYQNRWRKIKPMCFIIIISYHRATQKTVPEKPHWETMESKKACEVSFRQVAPFWTEKKFLWKFWVPSKQRSNKGKSPSRIINHSMFLEKGYKSNSGWKKTGLKWWIWWIKMSSMQGSRTSALPVLLEIISLPLNSWDISTMESRCKGWVVHLTPQTFWFSFPPYF